MTLSRLQHEFIEHILLTESEGSVVTDSRWADTRKLKPATVTAWRNGKEFSAALEVARSQWKDKSPSDRRTHLWILDEAIGNYDRCRSEAERRHWWKVIYDLTKPEDMGAATNYAGHTDEELWALIESRGLSEELEQARLKAALGEPCQSSTSSPVESAPCAESGSDSSSPAPRKRGRPRKSSEPTTARP